MAELQAMGGGTAHAVVRAAWNDQVIIKRLLDIGAQSLLIPYVETEEEARRAVMSVRYPPDGFRGVASLTRASRYGRIKGYYEAAQEQLCLLLQVETKRGLQNLDKIARVEGVDGVFIGPSDLSAGLGYLGKPTHPEVVKTIEEFDSSHQGRRRRARNSDRRCEAGPALYRSWLSLHRRRLGYRTLGERRGPARPNVQEPESRTVTARHAPHWGSMGATNG